MNMRLVSVDLWGTMFRFKGEISPSMRRRELVRRYAAKHGVMDAELVDRAYADAGIRFGEMYEAEAVTLSPRDRLLHQLNLIGVKEDGDEFEQLLESVQVALLHSPPPLAPNLRHGLSLLSDRFTLVVVSDTGFTPGRVIRDILKSYEIDQYFTDYSFSDENGKSKPNPYAFTSVLDRLDVAHSEFLHIGDTEWTDIKGAQSLGARACLYVGINDKWLNNTEADFVLHNWADVSDLMDRVE